MNDLFTQKLQSNLSSRKDTIDKMAYHCEQILDLLGQDLDDENLIETPHRMAKYLYEFLNYEPGNHETSFQSITADQLVMVRDIPFWSLCAHHLLFFQGTVSVAYLTGEKVIGLSKIPRIVQKHAHKLQLQEKLAHDISNELSKILETESVAVVIKGNHSCMQARGIKSEGDMVTSVLKGQFRDETAVRIEFFSLLK